MAHAFWCAACAPYAAVPKYCTEAVALLLQVCDQTTAVKACAILWRSSSRHASQLTFDQTDCTSLLCGHPGSSICLQMVYTTLVIFQF